MSLCSDGNMAELLKLKSTLYNTLIPLSIFQYMTFFDGNQLYKVDEKVMVELPTIQHPAPTLVVAQSSFVPAVLTNSSPTNYDVVSAASSSAGDNYFGPTIAEMTDLHAAHTAASSHPTSDGGTYADMTFAGEAQGVALDFNNNAFLAHNYTTSVTVQPKL